LIQLIMTFSIIFYLEGLFHSRLMPVFAITGLFLMIIAIGFADRMPLSVQRTISFLPIHVDPVAKASAQDSSEWRIQMWKDLIPQIPKYLLVGKGLAFSGNDLRSLTTSRIGGKDELSFEGSSLAGDYHNGPLSVIVPFGIGGVVAWLWFLWASLRALYNNYKFGNPELKRLNVFLFSYFISKTILFFFVFGSLYSDLPAFIGIIALSISLNAGIAKPVTVMNTQSQLQPFRVHPSRRPIQAT
jgi:hypothetical protein